MEYFLSLLALKLKKNTLKITDVCAHCPDEGDQVNKDH